MATTPGQQLEVRYVEEATPGMTPADPAFLLYSREVQSVKLSFDPGEMPSHDVGELDTVEHFRTKNVYGMEVKCHVHDEDRFFDWVDRNADDSPISHTVEIIPDARNATPHYIRATAARISKVDLEGGDGEPLMATIMYVGMTIAAPTTSDPGIGTGSREVKASITAPIRHFHAGAITEAGVAIATLVKSFKVTIDNQVNVEHTQGSADPVAAAVSYGKRKITGQGDISLDAGFATHWTKVANGSPVEIRWPFGITAGDGILVLTDVTWPKLDAEVTNDTPYLQGSQPFNAVTFSEATVV